jgi:hypothetical protein
MLAIGVSVEGLSIVGGVATRRTVGVSVTARSSAALLTGPATVEVALASGGLSVRADALPSNELTAPHATRPNAAISDSIAMATLCIFYYPYYKILTYLKKGGTNSIAGPEGL